ncbi:hypothetical protein [Proteus columbae]|uniref:hypothetical protein n=1 Tax=Proteus columbae TaxID=1987580 RepID=UPI00288A3261|nr:hypothetical protein [Proteus columbae]
MKKYNISRINQGIMLSFILLSSGVLASDNLNFKYTRADVSSSDGSLSKVANSCHTLTDPINIRVLFGPMDTTYKRVRLIVNGFNATYGYAPYVQSNALEKSAKPTVDPSRSLFGASTTGGVAVTTHLTQRHPTMGFKDMFCFSEPFVDRGREELSPSYYYTPIYENPPYEPGFSNADFERYCQGRTFTGGLAGVGTYWPGYDPVYSHARPSALVETYMKQDWKDYMGKYMFYRQVGLVPPEPGDKGDYTIYKDDINSQQGIGCELGSDKPCLAGFSSNIDIEFPLHMKKPEKRPDMTIYQSKIGSGEFNIKMNNRNISVVQLQIYDEREGQISNLNEFVWERTNFASNVLKLTKIPSSSVVSAGNVAKDPYQPFYTKDVVPDERLNKEYYRGTLLGASSLNQKYNDNNNKVIALSLPAESRGDINLVNTDSLTFQIDSVNGFAANIVDGLPIGGSSEGGTRVTIYGQPLKFNPTKSGDVERFNALQVRNACY